MEISEQTIRAWKNHPEYTVLDVAQFAAGLLPVDFNTFLFTEFPEKELCRRLLIRLKGMLFNDSPDFKKYVLSPKDGDENKRLCTEPLGRKAATDYLTRLVGTPNFLAEAELESPLPQIDPNHPMVSDTFKIAIQAWEAVLAPNPPKPKRGSRKSLIFDWLEINHKNLPKTEKERIATLLNPDNKGGAPSSK